MIRANWKWFVEAPLSPAWRSRLELCLGMVLSGAAVVALSSSIRPDPAKVAALRGTAVLTSSPPPPHTVETASPPRPSLPPAFVSALRAGNVAAMKKAYRPGVPLDGTLAVAAQAGHKDAVVWLLAHGADIHDDEQGSYSPLLLADAFPEVTALLRRKGAAEPSLENAAWANAPNALSRLLDAHPNQAKNGAELRAAASTTRGTASNKQLIVTQLLDAGADPNTTNSADSALGGAVTGCDATYGNENLAGNCMTIVRLLLDHGARVTGDALGAALSLDAASRAAPLEALLERPLEKGVTATALARATSIRPSDLKRVVALGIDWAWHDGERDAALPIFAAVRRGNRDDLRALIDAGAPVDVHFKDGSCALTEAIDNAKDNSEEARIVELLVTRGASVNRRLPDGRTPLFAAAESGDLRVINFLLDHGARVNDFTLDDTALDAAEQHGNLTAARILHAHGAHRARPASMY